MFEFLTKIFGAKAPSLPGNIDKSTVTYGTGLINKGKDTMPLLMDIYKNKNFQKNTSILCVHGGSFEKGSRTDSELVKVIINLVNQGYTCYSIDYRLAKHDPPAVIAYSVTKQTAAAHASFVDTKLALRFIQMNSTSLGIDPNKIILFGESAGGMACISVGISDPLDFIKDGDKYSVQNPASANEIRKVKAIISLWGGASFLLNKFDATDPAMLIFHGTKDDTLGVSFAEAIVIENRCKKYNIPCKFYKLVGFGHGAWDAKVGGKSISDLIISYLANDLKVN